MQLDLSLDIGWGYFWEGYTVFRLTKPAHYMESFNHLKERPITEITVRSPNFSLNNSIPYNTQLQCLIS